MSDDPQRVVLEADGGSRGNPGPAAYGALLRDAATGRVLAEAAGTIGVATNNVAEYRGLLAGLELVVAHTPDSRVEVRMDSKLVVEQMAGRWKVKHATLRPLALRAQRLAPPGTTWTWVPRARNVAADELVNAVLDGRRAEGAGLVDETDQPVEPGPDAEHGVSGRTGSRGDPLVGWLDREQQTPTTVVLLRHGVTVSTEARLFCGSGGSDPALTGRGREQAGRAGRWLARRVGADPVGLDGVGAVDAVTSSPLRRCRETAQIAANGLGLEVEVDDGLAEAAFGDWDGLTFAEVQRRWPDLLQTWLGDPSVAPPGGESNAAVARRTAQALARLVAAYAGRTVLAVSHVTPIKAVVRQALDAPVQVMHRMQLAPGSLTVTQWWPDGVSVLRTFSVQPD